MATINLHEWQMSAAGAIEIQKRLAPLVSTTSKLGNVRYIAGVDISVHRLGNSAVACVVLMDYPELNIIEIQSARGIPGFPYIPGLLSFRESPLILTAFEQLNITPDLIIVDGQGIAHPRRLGLASHLGLFLDIPTIGCAKSRLCGSHTEPESEPGDYSNITDKDEIIGVALRTKRAVKPVFVSTGHKIDLHDAIDWVTNCCRGYRLPEPTRQAHLAAGKYRRKNDLSPATV